jgi:hypothetical protein
LPAWLSGPQPRHSLRLRWSLLRSDASCIPHEYRHNRSHNLYCFPLWCWPVTLVLLQRAQMTGPYRHYLKCAFDPYFE